MARIADSALIFSDGGSHVVDSDVRPDSVEVFDDPGGAPTTVRIDAGAVVGTYVPPDGSFGVFGTSIGAIYGGFLEDDVESYDEATISIFGGTSNDDIQAWDISTIAIFGGIIGDDVEAFHGSTIEIFGGEIAEDVEAHHYAMISIFGGDLGTSGSFGSGIGSYDDSMIALFGHGFMVNGMSVGFGGITELSGILSGTLRDGSDFSVPFEQDEPGQIKLNAALEPSTHALLGLGLVGFGFGRRRGSKVFGKLYSVRPRSTACS